MRAALRTALSLLALAAALSGCANTEEETRGKRKPLKVQHALGETRVPFMAERPVTLAPSALETALALGLRPVGSATAGAAFPDYLGGRVRGIERVGTAAAPRIAAVIRLDPDVILGNERYQRRLYARLEKIAPTVMSGVPLSEWKSDVRFFAEAFGRTDEGERLLDDYDRRAGRARRALERSHVTGREALNALSPALRRELAPGFLAEVFRDVGLRPPATVGMGRGGGLIAARLVLADLEGAGR